MFCLDRKGVAKGHFRFLLLYILFATSFFKFSFYPGGWVGKLILMLLFIYTLSMAFQRKANLGEKRNFNFFVYLFLLLPVASAIPCYLMYGQSLLGSIRLVATTYIFTIYFYLHAKKVSEKTVLYTLLVSSTFLAFIQIVQQFLPQQMLLFGVSHEDILEGAEVSGRYGFLRFRIGYGGCLNFCVLFYAWQKILKKYKKEYLVTLILMLTSIYLMLTRQVMFAVALSMVIPLFFFKMKKRILNVVALVLVCVAVIYVNYDSLFGEMLSRSVSEISDDDYIRFQSANYFYEHIWDSKLTGLFGHGLNEGGSRYDAYINRLALSHLHTSDVGFIGAAFRHGWLYVATFFLLLIKIIRERKKLPPYVLMYFIAATATIVMIWPLTQPIQSLVFALVLYICDLHINDSCLAMRDA